MNLIALCAVLVLQAEPAVDDKQEDRGPKNWEIYGAVMGGVRLSEQGGGGVAAIGVNRRFWFVRPELMVGLGAYDKPADMLTVIRIGARLEWPFGESAFKPYLWLAFAHNHESGFDDVKQAPLAQIFGLSEQGVHHRSGAEAGLGFSWQLPRILTDVVRGKIGARLTFTQFLGDSYPPRYLDLTLTAGLAF